MAERILVVDDDESLLDLTVTAFKLEGYEVSDASSAEGALKRLESGPVDLVLSDLFMPGRMDGQGLLRAVKARYPSIEVVMMTAVPTLRTAIATLKDGASDYVIKPFETDHLKVVVRRALDHRRLKRELENERSVRKELESAYQELQKVEQLKESFLARVSHELRTPLSELLAAVELMEQAAGSTTDPKKIEKYLALSRKGAKRLEHTMSDLLAFVELQGRHEVAKAEPIALEPLCRELVEKLKPLAEPRGIRFSIALDKTPPVKGDRALLSRAFEHLLQNAVVFNRESGSVDVGARQVDGLIEVSVADTGEGIPETEFDKIFDSFYQIASYLTRKVGGLGLGLAITRRIVEAHGGRVDVQSKLGVGTTFRVQLPAAS